MKRFFCDECGKKFLAIPSKYSGAVECPSGCGYCCFEDTYAGRMESLTAYLDYEDEIEF